ncbi:MAG: hypothetical protein RLZZ200_2980 [Pseudomonadota bacterium]|jgi:beta-glucosidase
MRSRIATLVGLLLAPDLQAAPPPTASDPDVRAAATVKLMTAEERNTLLHGPMAVPLLGLSAPKEAIPGAGHIPGIPRLGLPNLAESDASLGVAYVFGLRKDGATALPSGMAMGASWNPDLLREGGAMIAREAHSKGFNVLLAGGVNLIREPRGGRTFEYLSEDPLLSGTLGGAAISGIQSEHVISTVKHFALNNQETGRSFHDVRLSDAAARESDLLAFQIAIERGQPGSVMCSYNRIWGEFGCENDYLLNQVLKRDWGYKGWVMSDWGAVHSVGAALKGLDQQSGEQLDEKVFFGQPLLEAAARDPKFAARVEDMNRRILRTMYAVGLDTHPPKVRPIDFKANGDVAEKVAHQGIVLLKNTGNALPLDAAKLKRVAVIGGYADAGVPTGGGSSRVQGEGGPALTRPTGNYVPELDMIFGESYHRSVPLKAIRERAPQADVRFRNGRNIEDAVILARQSDVAIVFATQPMTEGFDEPGLNLPDGQNELIAAVAAANPRTIVVLETGGAVFTPWLDRTAAVLEAWFPGARGAEAIAGVLFGDVNPSGRLPISFPASLAQLPRPDLPGADFVEPDIFGKPTPGQSFTVNYDIEGADVGYRWYARTGKAPLFWMGHGLTYTRFETSGLKAANGKALSLSATVRNAGDRAGDDVVQFYLSKDPAGATRKLVGYQRVSLAPGESRTVNVDVDPRLLARWRNGSWQIDAGEYRVATGRSAGDLGESVDVKLAAKKWSESKAR